MRWGRTVRGRHHSTARSGEGRGGQRGGRATRCGRQQHAGGSEIGEAVDCQVGPWHSNERWDLNSKKKKSNSI
jgi:hypothetical protein